MPEPIIAAATNKQAPAQKAAPAAAPPANPAPAAESEAKQQIVSTQTGKTESKTGDKKEKVQARTEQPVPKKDGEQQPNSWGMLLASPMVPIILMFVIMMFVMSRLQKKQNAKRQEMIDKITKGTKVLLASGIYATVSEVHEKTMIVEIASGVKIKIAKTGVADVVTEEVKIEGK